MRLSCLCGVCSTDFESAAHAPYSTAVLFEKMKERGFEAVQFAFSSIAESDFTPTGQIEIPAIIPDAAICAVQANAEKYGIPVKVINGTFNMAHPDKEIREEGIRRFHVLCRASKQLGAAYISLCSGTRNPDNLWAPHPDNDTDAAWEDMLDAVSNCTRIAEQYGIVLAVESEASNIISTPERARRLMDTIGSPNLKMILDCANLFHAGTAHPKNVRATLDHAFALYGQDIVLAHGKDICEGDGIAFCGTGRGIIDFAYTAKLLADYGFLGDMFLHGIYDEDDMVRAREHWQTAVAIGTDSTDNFS
ncbi:MAG: sugar phosphate isomerase/epimerase [Clostridia bacterium]|nr:sugar phosphate isomerase/epimerase [Clostridia bacterium]